MSLRVVFLEVAATLVLFSAPGLAETLSKSGRFGGADVAYKVILPPGYDAAREYPTVLAFGGGSQTMDTVERTLERNWRTEAERRGYIVVSPAAPNGDLFFWRGERIFPEFLDRILHDYKVQGGKFHIAGPSNGGVSAFHVAARFPQYFWSVTGFPGYFPEEDSDSNLDGLKKVCLYMHVGELDSAWRPDMQQQAERLLQSGFKVRFFVEKGQEHGIATLAGDGARRLFDQIAEAAKGCN